MNAGVILKSKFKEISITGSKVKEISITGGKLKEISITGGKVKVPGERESAVFHNQGVAFLDVCKTAGFV